MQRRLYAWSGARKPSCWIVLICAHVLSKIYKKYNYNEIRTKIIPRELKLKLKLGLLTTKTPTTIKIIRQPKLNFFAKKLTETKIKLTIKISPPLVSEVIK